MKPLNGQTITKNVRIPRIPRVAPRTVDAGPALIALRDAQAKLDDLADALAPHTSNAADIVRDDVVWLAKSVQMGIDLIDCCCVPGKGESMPLSLRDR